MSFQDENKSQPGTWVWNRTKYKYDGDGRRVVKSVPGMTTYYFYDPSGHLLTELSPGAGATVGTDYAYLDGAPVARVDWFVIEQGMGDELRAYKSMSNVHLDWTSYSPTDGTYVVRRKEVVNPDDKSFDGAATIATRAGTDKSYDDPVVGNGHRYDYVVFKNVTSDALFFYHADHLGTPIAMTSASSGLVWKAEYRPFGEADVWSGSTKSSNLRFPGQYFDQETGFHQNWFRDYDPKTGRYREADPIGLAGGLNPYAYTNSDPVNWIDPWGLDPLEIIFWGPVGQGRSSFGHVSERIGDMSYSFGENGNDVHKFGLYLSWQWFRNGHGLVIDVPSESLTRIEQMLRDFDREYGAANNNCTRPVQEALGNEFGFARPGTPSAWQGSLLPASLEEAIRRNFNVIGTTFYPKHPREIK